MCWKLRTFPSFIWFHPYFLLPWPHPAIQARFSDADIRCNNIYRLTSSVQFRSFYCKLSWDHMALKASSMKQPIHTSSHVIFSYPCCRTGISTSWVEPGSRQQHMRYGYGSQKSYCILNVSFSWQKRGRCFLSPYTGMQRVRMNTLHLKRFSGFAQKSCPENRKTFVRGTARIAEHFYEH